MHTIRHLLSRRYLVRCSRFESQNPDLGDLYSNPLELPFTPVELRELAAQGTREEGLSEPVEFTHHGVARRIGPKKVEDALHRYEEGESARSITARFDVSPAAVINLLRDNGVVVTRRRVTEGEAKRMAEEYEAGATMAEI